MNKEQLIRITGITVSRDGVVAISRQDLVDLLVHVKKLESALKDILENAPNMESFAMAFRELSRDDYEQTKT